MAERGRGIHQSDLYGDAARSRKEFLIKFAFLLAACVTVLVGVLIIQSLVSQAIGFVTQIDMTQLLGIGWFPRRGIFDVPTIVLGSLIVTGIAMSIATPIGLATAIYLAEYARPRVRDLLKPALEILSGIPSVVIGFFALTAITPSLIQSVFDEAGTFNLAAAGIGVGILSIPLVASVSEDAMRSVPNTMREAAFGLGARRLTVTARVVIPSAMSGIVAALILASSRAIGETMVVAVAAGSPQTRTTNPLDPGGTMTSAMVSLATGSDQVTGANAAFQSLFFVGLLLFLMTLGLNLLGESFVRRTQGGNR